VSVLLDWFATYALHFESVAIADGNWRFAAVYPVEPESGDPAAFNKVM
jgi:hypothetical protein